MKTFQSEVYNRRARRYETVLVSWRHSSLSNKTDVLSIRGRDGDITADIESSHIESIKKEAEKLSRYLNHSERVKMMNEIYSEA